MHCPKRNEKLDFFFCISHYFHYSVSTNLLDKHDVWACQEKGKKKEKRKMGRERKTFKGGRFPQKAVILKAFILNHGQNKNDGCCSCNLFQLLFLCCASTDVCWRWNTKSYLLWIHSNAQQVFSEAKQNRKQSCSSHFNSEQLKAQIFSLWTSRHIYYTHTPLTWHKQGPKGLCQETQSISVLAPCPDGQRFTTSEAVPDIFSVLTSSWYFTVIYKQ